MPRRPRIAPGGLLYHWLDRDVERIALRAGLASRAEEALDRGAFVKSGIASSPGDRDAARDLGHRRDDLHAADRRRRSAGAIDQLLAGTLSRRDDHRPHHARVSPVESERRSRSDS